MVDEELKKENAEDCSEAEAKETENASEQVKEEKEGQPSEDEKTEPETKDGKSKKNKKKSKADKPDKRDAEIEKLKETVEDLTDRLKRSLAEFENFRRRSEKEKGQMVDVGAKTIVEYILPVVDNFERGLATLDDKTKEEDGFAKGMDQTYKQLLKSLDDAGVKEIEALGKEFNPELHNAAMHEDNDKFGENTVSEVFQKGYTYHDSVVRHSMVKVAN